MDRPGRKGPGCSVTDCSSVRVKCMFLLVSAAGYEPVDVIEPIIKHLKTSHR